MTMILSFLKTINQQSWSKASNCQKRCKSSNKKSGRGQAAKKQNNFSANILCRTCRWVAEVSGKVLHLIRATRARMNRSWGMERKDSAWLIKC